VAKFSSLQTTKSLPMLLESSKGIKTHDSVTTQLILLAPSFPLHHPPPKQSKTHLRINIHTHTYIWRIKSRFSESSAATLSRIKFNGFFFKEFFDVVKVVIVCRKDSAKVVIIHVNI
jgi:hypothetical protein